MKKFNRLTVGFVSGVVATSLLFMIRAIELPTIVFWLVDFAVVVLSYFCAYLISRPDYKGTKIQGTLLNLSDISISSKETKTGTRVDVLVPENLIRKDPKNVQNIMISVRELCATFEEKPKKTSTEKSTSKKSTLKKTSSKKVKK